MKIKLSKGREVQVKEMSEDEFANFLDCFQQKREDYDFKCIKCDEKFFNTEITLNAGEMPLCPKCNKVLKSGFIGLEITNVSALEWTRKLLADKSEKLSFVEKNDLIQEVYMALYLGEETVSTSN